MADQPTSPERQLAELLGAQLAKRERRTGRALIAVERQSLRRVKHVVQLATESVAAEAVRVHGLSPATSVRRQSPTLQASVATELLASKRAARVTGRHQLEADLERHFPMVVTGAELDAAAAFVAAAGITAAWGSAALQAVAANAPLRRVASEIAANVERTVATEVARSFNHERNAIIVDLGIGGDDDADHGGGGSSRLQPGLFKVYSAVLDGRTCQQCFGADGEIVEPQKAFKSGTPPLHPRCRCIVEHLIVPKTERLEDIGIDYELFKQELRDVIRENRIISGRHALGFASDSLGSKRSAEVLTRRFRNEAYATSGPSAVGGRVKLVTPRKTP